MEEVERGHEHAAIRREHPGGRATPPWESTDQCVAMAWQDLTRPENLTALLEWGKRDLNPHARECTDKAIAVCRSRSKSNGEPDT